MILRPGQSLDQGRYVISGLLGSGGMGEVYLARQVSVERDVAIKVLYPRLTHESLVKQRFHREAKLMAQLNHPHCVTIYDYGETEEGLLYIVMERLQGRTLADELIYRERLTLTETLSVARQVCLALHRAHELYFVHRDLKPENLYLSPPQEKLDSDRYFADLRGPSPPRSGQTAEPSVAGPHQDTFHVKVLDFGIAKALQSSFSDADSSGSAQVDEAVNTLESEGSDHLADTLSEEDLINTIDAAEIVDRPHPDRPHLDQPIKPKLERERRRHERSLYTKEHVIIGTPLYMSPEHLHQATLDHRADIYALGLIMYECLAGQPAFKGSSITDLLHAHLREVPPKLSEVRPDLPLALSDLIDVCLVKSIDLRINDVILIAQSIEKIERDEPLSESVREMIARVKRAQLNERAVGTNLDTRAEAQIADQVSESAQVQRQSISKSALIALTSLSFIAGALSLSLLQEVIAPPLPSSEIPPPVGASQGSPTLASRSSQVKRQAPPSKPQPSAQWLKLYGPEGQVKLTPQTLLLLDFNQDLVARSGRDAMLTPPHRWSDIEILRQWRLLTQDVDQTLRGVQLGGDQGTLHWDTSVRLPNQFTIELWVYLSPIQEDKRCARSLLNTFQRSESAWAHQKCLYTEANLKPGGWGVLARTLPRGFEVEWRTFGFPNLSAPRPVIRRQVSREKLRYGRWNHIALSVGQGTFSWVINGVEERSDFELPDASRDQSNGAIHLGEFARRYPTLGMRIDDIRISGERLESSWIIEAYRRRLSHHQERLRDEPLPPPARIYY